MVAVYATCKQISKNQCMYRFGGHITIDKNVNIDGLTVVMLLLSLFSVD
jgi:hypothetical protein